MSSENHDDLIIPNEILEMIEAILFVAPAPVSAPEIEAALGLDETTVECALQRLQRDYDGEGKCRRRGFELRTVNEKWRLYTRPQWREATRTFISGTKSGRLSQAALETLAIIAYKQPVARAEISDIRGVNVDSVVRNLLLRGLIEETETNGTNASTLVTTDAFLELFSLASLKDLPPLAPAFPTVETLPETIQEIEEIK